MTRAEPPMRVDGPDARGLLAVHWPGLERVRGVGRTAEQARAAAFDALVEELRRGMTTGERERVRAYKRLPYAERTRRAAALMELTWRRP